MVDLWALSGIVSTILPIMLSLYIVLFIALDWIHYPFGHK